MRFYLDENFPPHLVHPLRNIYTTHEFTAWSEEGLGSTLDVDLFPELAKRGYGAIITRDRQQLKNADERAALLDAGLRWVGLRETKLAGLAMISITAASLIAGLRFVIDHEAETVEHSYLIKNVPHDTRQRMHMFELQRA